MIKRARKISIICATRGPELPNRIKNLFNENQTSVIFEPSLDKVLERFETANFDILIISSASSRTGTIDGIDLIEVITEKSPATQILFLADSNDMQTAMSSIRAGTYQYARVPISDQELKMLIETALSQQPQFGENLLLKQKKSQSQFEELVGKSEAMQNIYKQIKQAAATDIPILVTGETGTGKDLAARAIHSRSPRVSKPFVPINLAAFPKELVASELFGHEKGSFTGAMDRHHGIFERAENGTVFLDEIGTIDEKVQVSLLRLIEQKTFHRLGGKAKLISNTRVIAASNENLHTAIAQGKFRADLFYRLDVFHIDIPPLRQRTGDIPLLIGEFMQRYNASFQKKILGISPECVTILENYKWPGNVRELKNVIQRAVLVCTGDVLLPSHLPARLRPTDTKNSSVTFEIGTPLVEIEKEMIIQVLATAKGNRTKAAKLLGISRRALYNKIHRYQI